MKTKLTLLFALFCLTLSAQKELQSYEYKKSYKVTDKDGNTENKDIVLIIKASAKSANNITFYLNNSKGEPIMITTSQTEDNSKQVTEVEKLEFTVSPFIETIFSSKLKQAIDSLETHEEFKNKKKAIETLKKDKDNYRNIFQFFNALAITAFQYDTEPVAGTLKYKLNEVKVSKEPNLKISKLIKNISRKRLSYFLEYDISKKNNVVLNTKKDTSFLKYLHKNFDKIEEHGYEERKAIRRTISWLYLDNFELNNQKVLKKIYHEFQLENFLIEDDSFFNYIFLKLIEKNLKKDIKEINESISLKNEEIKKYNEKTIKTDSIYNSKFKKIVDDLLDTNDKYENEIKVKKDLIYLNQKDLIYEYDKSQRKKIELTIKRLSKYIDEISIINKRYNQDFVEKEKILIEKHKKIYDKLTKFKNKITELREDVKKIEKNNLNPLLVAKKKNRIKIGNLIPKMIRKNPQLTLWDFETKDIQIDFNDGFIEHISVVGSIQKPYLDFKGIVKILDSLNKKIQANKNDLIRELTAGDSILNNLTIDEIDSKDLNDIITNFYKEPLLKESFNTFLNKELKFENQFPIGFSSKSDFSDMYGYDLVHIEDGEPIFKLPVTEVLKVYNQRLQNDRLDFSPKNQVLNISSDNPHINNEVELKKEQSSKILSARFYSDFLGLKEGNPNGLIQAEIEKKIPLWTKRFPSPFFGKTSNKGFFNYVKLNLTFSRIEDREQNLQVSYADEYANNVYTPKKFVTYMDLVRRENTSVGIDANLLSFDFTAPKLRLEINAGVHFARVRAIDSLRSSTDNDKPLTNFFNKSVNTVRYYPDFILRVRPEERFGGFIRFRPFRILTPREDEFFSVSSRRAFLDNREIREAWLHRIEMSLFYKPNPKGDNKFFFRYRNTNVSTWETNGFGEFQVGYQAYLKF